MSGEELHGLAPVVGRETRLVVLGSFPSVASLRAQQYYAHPRNQFWPLLSAIWGVDLVAMPYRARLAEVKRRGLGIWDVYARCRREGSLDSAIRAAELNDFPALLVQCPQLSGIAHNGGESFRHARHTRALGLPVYRLPSSSAANAKFTAAVANIRPAQAYPQGAISSGRRYWRAICGAYSYITRSAGSDSRMSCAERGKSMNRPLPTGLTCLASDFEAVCSVVSMAWLA